MKAAIEDALREALGDGQVRVTDLQPVGGGCISHAARVTTTAGPFFAKWNDACPPELFAREADGLRELAAAGSGLVLPRVFGAWTPQDGRPALIIMEYLPPADASADEESLGRALGQLHRHRAPEYGFAVPTYCGSTRQENPWTVAWPDFFRDQRMAPLVRRVAETRGLGPAERRTYDRLLERLPALLSHDTVPSLIHGDLWSGNVLHTERGPGLVDPACAYADREMEFGIVTLFGGFGSRFWRGYEEVAALPPDWRERNPLYQLYHLLNHFHLFGEGYGAQALAIARRFI